MNIVAGDASSVLSLLEGAQRFVVQQVFRPIANEYRIGVAAPGSTDEAQPLLFVRQKKMRIREDIRFRISPDSESHVFMIKSRTVFEFAGRHDVLDADGAPIGTLEKDFGRSLLRSHWRVRDASGEQLLEGHEASWIIAIVRRVAGLAPEWLGVLQWLPFNFLLIRDGRQVGTYARVLGALRDRYVLELGDELRGADRRLLLAFAVALDALQDR
jgi:uncharacterized protein YxjI